jgi:hypothetical protein
MSFAPVFVACLIVFDALHVQPTAATSPSDAAALQEFDAAVRHYMTLRNGLRNELPALAVTNNPAEIVARSDALALAIERGRVGAARGEFFTARVVDALRKRLSSLANHPDVRDTIAPEGDEKATLAALRLHVRFPNGSAMPTMPTVLLDALPPLPSSLEYRFIGTTLVLRDVEAALILDFAPNLFSLTK